jgi:hypothetical protein
VQKVVESVEVLGEITDEQEIAGDLSLDDASDE